MFTIFLYWAYLFHQLLSSLSVVVSTLCSSIIFILPFVLEKSQTPTISAEKRLQIALPGSSVSLHCVVAQSSSRNNVRWYRQHYPLPQTANVDGEYLTINNLRFDDRGRYYCEVPINGGGVVNDYIDLEIQSEYSLCCDMNSSRTPTAVDVPVVVVTVVRNPWPLGTVPGRECRCSHCSCL